MLIVWKNKIWKSFSCIFSKQMNYSKKRLFILYSHNYTSRMFSLFKCKIASQLFLPKIVILKHLAISRQIFSNDGFDAIIFHRLIGHLNIHWQCPTGAYLLFLEFCSVDVTPQFLYQCLIRLFLTLTVFLVFQFTHIFQPFCVEGMLNLLSFILKLKLIFPCVFLILVRVREFEIPLDWALICRTIEITITSFCCYKAFFNIFHCIHRKRLGWG